jgi:class 3 adenylate cyclase
MTAGTPHHPPPDAALPAALQQQLHAIFFELWRFGSNALIGWRPSPRGIEVITLPKVRLFADHGRHLPVFSEGSLMAGAALDATARLLDVQPVEVRLDSRIGDAAGEIPPALVERVFRLFTVTRTLHRAVLLLDIVGFSKASPEEQAAQLTTLEFSLNLAEEMARAHGLGVAFGRTTTGDGFYVWNERSGLRADIDFFCAVAIFQILFAALRRTVTTAAAVPVLRLCLSIGSHFLYHQPRRDGSNGGAFIVGDVTIKVARLIGTAAPDQMLIGDFERPLGLGQKSCNTETFLTAVSERLAGLKTLQVLGERIDRISFYLTGPRAADGRHRPLLIRITDKHGFEHGCYNAKLNAFAEQGEPYYCGLQHAELEIR